MRGEKPRGESEFLLHVFAKRVVRLGGHAELPQARLTDLTQLVKTDRKADDALLRSFFGLARGGYAEHDRQVCDFQPALRQNRRERRLGRARDSDENDVGLLEIAWLLTVVALHGELDCLDAPEVLL